MTMVWKEDWVGMSSRCESRRFHWPPNAFPGASRPTFESWTVFSLEMERWLARRASKGGKLPSNNRQSASERANRGLCTLCTVCTLCMHAHTPRARLPHALARTGGSGPARTYPDHASDTSARYHSGHGGVPPPPALGAGREALKSLFRGAKADRSVFPKSL